MSRDEIIKRYPNASESFIRANLSLGDPEPLAKLESNLGDAPLGKEEIQRRTGERVLVSVTSVRKRLLDEDNLCEKYHVDLCRYAGIIPDDAPYKIKIDVSQRKTSKGESEHTIIEVRAKQKERECRLMEITKQCS